MTMNINSISNTRQTVTAKKIPSSAVHQMNERNSEGISYENNTPKCEGEEQKKKSTTTADMQI